ncbi:HNH endonuclease family protein [Catenulispora acidiphila]|nr:HNH endonuclease [Catenulispora acidiphila]
MLADQTSKIEQAVSQIHMAKRLWKDTNVRSTVLTPHVRPALERMAPGIARCMYCGENYGTDIDHYRPKSLWPLHTFDWLNHLLSCSACNSSHKGNRFPLAEDGSPLLIDPTTEDPADHLHLTLATGDYIGLTSRGEATIKTLGLNRGVLVQGRARAVRDTVRLMREWRIAIERQDILLEEIVLNDLRQQPFTAVADALFRQASGIAVMTIFSADLDTLAFLRDPEVLETASRALVGR